MFNGRVRVTKFGYDTDHGLGLCLTESSLLSLYPIQLKKKRIQYNYLVLLYIYIVSKNFE